MTMDEYIKNELLCFLQQKSSVLKFDDLVRITAGFYSADEIKGALANITEASGSAFRRTKVAIKIVKLSLTC